MRHPNRVRTAAAVTACAVAGATAGIAGSMAAPAKHASARSAQSSGTAGRPAPPPRLYGGPPVHVEAVVPNKAGDAFITVTEDNGTVKSVDGDQLTITEGTKSTTYKTVTLTIPANATVRRNFAKASLSDLKAGDHVHVSQSSEGTTVLADDGTHRPPGGGPRGFHGPGGPGGPGGPPPGFDGP